MATNSNPKGEGVNKIVPLGGSKASSNDMFGFSQAVQKGTVGSRPDISSKYGGDKDAGILFKGSSTAGTDRQKNSGGGESPSGGAGQYGKGKPAGDYEKGTVASREFMPKYGGGPSTPGELVGLGVNATSKISPTDQLQRDLPTYPGLNLVDGTPDSKKNMARAQSGIGKPGKGGARM